MSDKAAAVEMIQTEKSGAESAQPPAAAGTKGKQRLPEEYVSLILAMPRDKPPPLDDTEEMSFPFMTPERIQLHKEGAARSERIHAGFLQFQNRVRDEFLDKGYAEVDDDYLTNIAETQKEQRALWEETKKKRNPILTFASSHDFYAHAPFDPVKQARSLLSDLN